MLIPSYVHILTLQKPHIPAGFNMCLVISKCVTSVKVSNFSGQYLRNHWTLDIGVLGYIGIVWPKEHPPEVLHIPPGTPCITVSVVSWLWHHIPKQSTTHWQHSYDYIYNSISSKLTLASCTKTEHNIGYVHLLTLFCVLISCCVYLWGVYRTVYLQIYTTRSIADCML